MSGQTAQSAQVDIVTRNFGMPVIGANLLIDGDVTTRPINQSSNKKAAGFQFDVPELPKFLQNLRSERPDQWARTAIIATPEQAQALIRLNSQLENPYQVKGAFLI